MKNITTIVGILAIILLTSATTASIITVKPAIPKYSYTRLFANQNESVTWANKMTKKGYIVKCYSMTIYGITMTLEKY